jgi:hypothetical protein
VEPPLYNYPPLDRLIGTQVYIKHENYQPIGAFKVRGGINLVSQLMQDETDPRHVCGKAGQKGPRFEPRHVRFHEIEPLICHPNTVETQFFDMSPAPDHFIRSTY